MKRFVTLLSSENYLTGVFVLQHSLVQVQSKYPLLVLLTPSISYDIENILHKSNILTKRILPKFTPPPEIIAKISQRRWANTFEKLQAFDLVEYEKIILIDSDMVVFRNIDHLFALPHLSAAKGSGDLAGYEHWQLFNTGLLVINPASGLGEKIFEMWHQVAEKTSDFGDQDLIKAYYGDFWLQNNLRLPTTYNCFAPFMDRLIHEKGYNLHFSNPDEHTISVIHYVNALKPWEMSYTEFAFFLLKRLIKRQKYYAWAVYKHIRLQRKIKSYLLKKTK